MFSTGKILMAKVTRLRTKRQGAFVEACQLVLDFGEHFDLSQSVRDEIAGAVGKLAPPEQWGFVMLNPEQQRAVLKAIMDGPKPLQTVAVWNACISFIAYDRDGEIMASRTQIAEAAGVLPQHTSTALSRLVEIGVLSRIARGRFRVNPYVAWCGPLPSRDNAVKEHRAMPVKAPALSVVEGGKP